MGLIKSVAMAGDVPIRGPNVPTNGTNKSLLIDTAGEQLAHTSGLACSHFKNLFTIAIWFTKEQEAGGGITDVSDGTTIRVRVQPISATDFRVIIRTVGTTVDKNLRINPFPAAAGVWRHLVIVLDRGASTEVKLYLEANLISPTIVVDNPLPDGSHLEIDSITVGASAAPDQRQYSYAVWNKALNQNEITAIYNNGKASVNLLKNKGKYKSAKKLQHWFVYESDPNNMGKDYGRARSEGMNLMTNATDITADDDLVAVAPF
jgi:hypothetical protein